jgi:lipid II:glycine glycyltransferase (peptidoglycan interpeptide bridge formation enzyme)
MGFEIVQNLPTDQWRTFVDEHPKGNIFHTPEMFQVFQHTKGDVPELWAALDAGEILALFVPVHISLRKGVLRRLTTRTVSFGSVLSVPGQRGDQALMQLLQVYKASSGRQSLFTETRNLSPLNGLCKVLEEQGFAYEDHLNYLIDLDRPAEAVFQGIGKRTRRNIKSGLQKALVTVEEVNEQAGLVDCYRLLAATYQAAHVPLTDRSLFEAALQILGPKGMVRFLVARIGDQPAATSIELLYKDVIYGWYGGTDRTQARFAPNELVTWNILEWGAEHGYRTYDFGGAGKPDQKYGVRDFKAKFGGQLVCYGRNVWIPNRNLYLLSSAAYAALRPLL